MIREGHTSLASQHHIWNITWVRKVCVTEWVYRGLVGRSAPIDCDKNALTTSQVTLLCRLSFFITLSTLVLFNPASRPTLSVFSWQAEWTGTFLTVLTARHHVSLQMVVTTWQGGVHNYIFSWIIKTLLSVISLFYLKHQDVSASTKLDAWLPFRWQKGWWSNSPLWSIAKDICSLVYGWKDQRVQDGESSSCKDGIGAYYLFSEFHVVCQYYRNLDLHRVPILTVVKSFRQKVEWHIEVSCWGKSPNITNQRKRNPMHALAITFAIPLAQSSLKQHLDTYRSKTWTGPPFERFGPRPASPIASTMALYQIRGRLIRTTIFLNFIRYCAKSWGVPSLRLPTNMSQLSTRILGTSYSLYIIARS